MKLLTNLLLASDGFVKLIDNEILNRFDLIQADYLTRNAMFLEHARLIAAIACFIYFAGKAFNTLSGDGQWEILPLLRPFGIGFIILNWASFVSLISIPFNSMENTAEGRLDAANTQVSSLLRERDSLHSAYAYKLIEQSEEIEDYKSKENNDEDTFSVLGLDFNSISKKISGLGILIMSKFRMIVENIILNLSIALFRICLYLILTLETFFKYILIVLGPLAFAFAIHPSFRESHIQWVGKFISICFYPILARLMAIISMNLIEYSLREELGMLRKVLANDDVFIAFVTSQQTQGGVIVVAFVVGGIGMLTIPVIAQWIVSTSGVGQAIGKVARGAAAVKTAGMSKMVTK